MADENFEDEIIYSEPESKKDDVPLMYVGPNIHKLGIEKYTIYRGELPPSVELAIDKIPEIIHMLIPVDELMKFTRNLLLPSSPERKYTKIIQDKAREL